MKRSIRLFLPLILLFNLLLSANVMGNDPKFKVIAFYTGINDQAHVSFVHEANQWFSKLSAQHHFSYESTFKSQPNEWYSWKNDLRKNVDIHILASIDSTSFPLGTGPKLYEIWHSGYFPVVWINVKYRMIYFNMGHNDIDYEHNTNKELSFTFGNKIQNKLITDALLWLGKSRREK